MSKENQINEENIEEVVVNDSADGAESEVDSDEVVEELSEISVDALEQMQQTIDDLNAQLAAKEEEKLLIAAEAQNLQRRMQRDIDNTRKFSNDKIIKALIPVMDSFDKALEVIEDDSCEVTIEAMIQGTENTHKIFSKVLEDNGISIINPVGEAFDPEQHEAMSMIASPDHEKNTVVNVFQKGYLLNDRVVRAAMVVVAQ